MITKVFDSDKATGSVEISTVELEDLHIVGEVLEPVWLTLFYPDLAPDEEGVDLYLCRNPYSSRREWYLAVDVYTGDKYLGLDKNDVFVLARIKQAMRT